MTENNRSQPNREWNDVCLPIPFIIVDWNPCKLGKRALDTHLGNSVLSLFTNQISLDI